MEQNYFMDSVPNLLSRRQSMKAKVSQTMKKTFSFLLVLIFVILSMPLTVAEESTTPTLMITESNIVTLVKFRTYIGTLIRMSDGSALPADMKYKLKNTKHATITNKGVITGKKAGTVQLTISSKKLKQSITCSITVLGNVFNETRTVEQLMQQVDGMNPLTYHGVVCYERKMYFKNGKLTIDIYFYNRFGYTVTKITNMKLGLYDTATGRQISKYSKNIVRSKKLNDGASFKFTISFPQKGLDKVYDLTQIGSDGYPSQIKIAWLDNWYYYHNAPVYDPWNEWDNNASIMRAAMQTSHLQNAGKAR